MDPFLLLAEWWWIAPAAVAGAGAVTVVGMRHRSNTTGRRLAFDAARDDLSEAQHQAGERRRAVKLARAEHARLVAERTAARATSADVASARRTLQQAERNAKAADAEVRARRVQLKVARAEIPTAAKSERFPVARLNRAHDAITARWMDYETDPAKLIAYPTMSDGKDPATSAFLSASRRAQEARPVAGTRITTEEYAAYRDAVAHLERTFDVAEHSAKARAEGRDPNPVPAWQDTAQQVFTRSADALDRAAGAAASAFASWSARRQSQDDQPADLNSEQTNPNSEQTNPNSQPANPNSEQTNPNGESRDDATRKPTKIWRIPRRDDS